MKMNLEKFFRQRYAAHIFTLGTDRAKPGFLLDCKWFLSTNQRPRFKGEDGNAWEFIGETEGDYPRAMHNANIVQLNVNDEAKIGAKVSLPQYGISIKPSASVQYKVKFEISEINAYVFKKGTSAPDLIEKLLDLKKPANPNHKYWDWVNDDFLITESFHVTAFKAKFETTGDVSAQAAYDSGEINFDANLTVSWINEEEATLVGSVDVPLAIRGFRI